jgi:NIMA (never in mitosis gene a)-related kinase
VHILASLDSPYIVKYYDSFIENKILYIVMEYCEMGDLSKVLNTQRGPMEEIRIWKFFL